MQIKAEQTVVLKEGDLLQLGRDSPTDKQILGKIKLFYPHEDSSLIPSSCAVLADTWTVRSTLSLEGAEGIRVEDSATVQLLTQNDTFVMVCNS